MSSRRSFLESPCRTYILNWDLVAMSWDNYGEWHIDHRIPLAYKQDDKTPTIEEVAKRLHYTNTQPLWASDNMSKGLCEGTLHSPI